MADSTSLQCEKDSSVRRGVCCRTRESSPQRNLVSPEIVRDIIIGLSDGLTVPFALTAGLSSLGSSHFVVLAGVAELISGAISMGVGGYFSAQAEREHYRFQARRVHQRVQQSCPKELADEVALVLEPYGAPYKLATSLSAHLWQAEQQQSQGSADSESTRGATQFLVRVKGGLEPISRTRVYTSGLTIGLAYLAGGVIPLLPYIVISDTRTALFVSIGVTAGLLLVFGVVKQHYSGAPTGARGYTSGAISTLFVGGIAAAASWGIVHAIEGRHL
jgi:VIT1/CCC1 family predicted Fe2+/Mn2+ transporter